VHAKPDLDAMLGAMVRDREVRRIDEPSHVSDPAVRRRDGDSVRPRSKSFRSRSRVGRGGSSMSQRAAMMHR
jgi:hypothetical protein